MKVDIAICGLSHYKSFVKYLSANAYLHRFYFSHKLFTNAQTLDLQRSECFNLRGKEHLIHIHGKTPLKKFPSLAPFYSFIWQLQFLRSNKQQGDLLDFAIHGSFLYALKNIREKYKLIVGHPLTSHPAHRLSILNTEMQHRNINITLPSAPLRMMKKEQKYCDYIHVASNFVKKTYIKNGIHKDKIKVIPYGANLQRFFKQTNTTHTKFRVLCVGNISLGKGQLYLIDAWKNMKLKNAELILVGKIQPHIKELVNLNSHFFTHYDHIPNELLPQLYNSVDVFILPSLDDGFGLVVLEAMACGLPVIVTESTGAADIIINGENGFIIPAASSSFIEEKIAYFYMKKNRCEVMGNASQKICMEQYNWKRYAKSLMTFYDKIMEC